MDDTKTYAESTTEQTPAARRSLEPEAVDDQVVEDQQWGSATQPRGPVSPRGPQRYDQMAKASSAGLMAHKDVESAIVEISGAPSDLVFHLTCTLVADIDPSAVMELIDHGVIPNVERMLGETFSSRDLQFKVAPSAAHSR